MNLIHLKYAVEVAKTGSVSKAAENLYMGQPNLSRAIKELEESLGVTIFKRTAKGIKPTAQGEEFLESALEILNKVESLEAKYKDEEKVKQQFSISIPRASYIAEAFLDFVKKLNTEVEAEIYYKETNAMRTISNVTQDNYNLGIIRFQTTFEPYFNALFLDKGVHAKELNEFSYSVMISQTNPLAAKKSLTMDDLANSVQIAHGDPYVPSVSFADVKKAELHESADKNFYVFERSSQYELLTVVPNSFMFVSKEPTRLLQRYGLILKDCTDDERKYKDVLIYKKDYRFSPLDVAFLEELDKHF